VQLETLLFLTVFAKISPSPRQGGACPSSRYHAAAALVFCWQPTPESV